MGSASVGQWERHYAHLAGEEPYGDSASYWMAADFMRDHQTMEDWGCGKGWLRKLIAPEAYLGVDGSTSPFADVVDDLATRTTNVEGIVLRHVLEHNDNWAEVLDNAIASASKRLCIVLFTPLGDETFVMMREPDYGNVPVISFKIEDITDRLVGCSFTVDTFESPQGSFYNVETVIRIEKVQQTIDPL